MTVTHHIKVGNLGVALTGCAKRYEDAIVIAMRKGAVFGQTAVVRTIKRTRSPEGYRIRASGTYESPANWRVDKIERGATLTALANHAYIVEVGREKGMPPKKPIWNWVQQKRIVPKSRAKNQIKRVMRIAQVVKAVRWKIAKEGIKGRWPLRRTMPAIGKYTGKEIRRQIRHAAGRPPRKKSKKKGGS